MPHYGVLGSNKLENVEDVRGAEVYGVNDEKLGRVDDVIFDHSNGEIRYVVVNTGWLASKKFLVPPNRISCYGNHEDKMYAELDKERIQMLPEYDEKMLKNGDDWSAYEKRFQEKWTDGAVLHNERTGRIVTPPLEETASTAAGNSGTSLIEAARDATPQRMGREDDLLGVASSGDKTTLSPTKPSVGGRKDVELIEQGRWQRFQEELRSDRDRVVSECGLCGSQKKVA